MPASYVLTSLVYTKKSMLRRRPFKHACVLCPYHGVHRMALAAFWRTFHHDGKISHIGEGGGCTPTPFHCSYHHVQSCNVHSSCAGRSAPLYSVVHTSLVYTRECILRRRPFEHACILCLYLLGLQLTQKTIKICLCPVAIFTRSKPKNICYVEDHLNMSALKFLAMGFRGNCVPVEDPTPLRRRPFKHACVLYPYLLRLHQRIFTTQKTIQTCLRLMSKPPWSPPKKSMLRRRPFKHAYVLCPYHGVHRVVLAAFWRTFHHDGKISHIGEGGGCTPTPFHCSYHHVQSCNVHSSCAGRSAPLYFVVHTSLVYTRESILRRRPFKHACILCLYLLGLHKRFYMMQKTNQTCQTCLR